METQSSSGAVTSHEKEEDDVSEDTHADDDEACQKQLEAEANGINEKSPNGWDIYDLEASRREQKFLKKANSFVYGTIYTSIWTISILLNTS